AAVAEREVVLLRTALVAVAFDEKVVCLPVALQPVGRRGERGLSVGAQRRLVVTEERILDVAAVLRDAIELFDVARKSLLLDLRRLLHEVLVLDFRLDGRRRDNRRRRGLDNRRLRLDGRL